jgi:L-asparaginase II
MIAIYRPMTINFGMLEGGFRDWCSLEFLNCVSLRNFASYFANFAVSLYFNAKTAKDSQRTAKQTVLND